MAVCYDMSVVCCVLLAIALCSGGHVSGQWVPLELLRNILKKRSKTKPECSTKVLLRHLFCLSLSIFEFRCAPKHLAYHYISNSELSRHGIPHFEFSVNYFDQQQQQTNTYNLQNHNTELAPAQHAPPLHRIIIAYCLRGNSLLIVVSTVRIKFETVPRSRATVWQHEHE